MGKVHYLWVDWMKVLAMYFIIAGHLFVPGYKYIYVFSVPSFFILSGVLFKAEPWDSFFKKLFWNLFVPMMALLLINIFFKAIENRWGLMPIIKVFLRSLAGYQGQNYSYGGLGALWFIYSLIVCRLIMQGLITICPNHYRILLLIINLLFILTCYVLNHREISYYFQFNSIVNVLLAFPFFSIGFLLSSYKQQLNKFPAGRLLLICLPLSLLTIFLCGKYNKIVYLYMCSYGNNMLLCFIGGVVGTFSLFLVSKLFENLFKRHRIIDILGQGTIIILGLHILIMTALDSLRSVLFSDERGFDLFILALIILLFFIPINLFVKRYLPFIYGKQRIERIAS